MNLMGGRNFNEIKPQSSCTLSYKSIRALMVNEPTIIEESDLQMEKGDKSCTSLGPLGSQTVQEPEVDRLKLRGN